MQHLRAGIVVASAVVLLVSLIAAGLSRGPDPVGEAGPRATTKAENGPVEHGACRPCGAVDRGRTSAPPEPPEPTLADPAPPRLRPRPAPHVVCVQVEAELVAPTIGGGDNEND